MMSSVFVFCLPFAGGNKYSYRFFEQWAPSTLELVTLEYPGRGARSHEPLLTDINMLAEDVYLQIRSYKKERFIIYGHSMGGLLAFLIARKFEDNNLSAPAGIFVTGACAPAARIERAKRHLMKKAEFLEEV